MLRLWYKQEQRFSASDKSTTFEERCNKCLKGPTGKIVNSHNSTAIQFIYEQEKPRTLLSIRPSSCRSRRPPTLRIGCPELKISSDQNNIWCMCINQDNWRNVVAVRNLNRNIVVISYIFAIFWIKLLDIFYFSSNLEGLVLVSWGKHSYDRLNFN